MEIIRSFSLMPGIGFEGKNNGIDASIMYKEIIIVQSQTLEGKLTKESCRSTDLRHTSGKTVLESAALV